MIEITNEEKFGKIIAASLAAVERNRDITSGEKLRWISAIAKASERMQTKGDFMTWQENNTLLIWSDSNEIYEANGTCQCLAFKAGQPCWHRAAKQLYQRYTNIGQCRECFMRNAQTGKTICLECEMDNAPMIRNTVEKTVEKRGGTKI
jgi:hypothetical protein